MSKARHLLMIRFSRHIFLSLLGLFACVELFAQGDQSPSSLYEEILRTRNPHTVLDLLKEVSISEVENDSLRAYFYYYRGSAYGQLASFDSADYYVLKAQSTIREGQYPVVEIQILRALGNISWARSFYNIALGHYQEALEIAQKIDHGEFIVSLLGNIAGVYAQLDDYELALEYALRSETESERTGVVRPRSHMKIGLYQMQLDKTEEGVASLKKTVQIITEEGRDSIALGVCLLNIAHGQLTLKKTREAKTYLMESQKVLENVGYADPQLYVEWGRLKLLEGNYKQARGNALKAQSQALGIADLVKLKASNHLLKNIAIEEGSFEEAIRLQDEIMDLNDSIKSQQTLNRVYELEAQFEAAQREAEIQRLEVENQLSELKADKFRNQMIFAVVGSLLIILLILALYLQRAKKAKAEKLAQESQYEALQKRFIEILNGPQTFELEEDLATLNAKLVNPLTEREYDALKLSLQGLTNKEIGDKLFVSDHTVKFHLRNIYNKLGVSNRKEALEYVVKSS
ncbi:MAG: LuxR C-terminal-related transcriptional regulator [Cyclobacteriaceae bacterium]